MRKGLIYEIDNYLAENNLGELEYIVKNTNSDYIYGVVAWKNGEYRCWTHYNTELHSMNCGHYGIEVDECFEVFDNVYGKNAWKIICIYGVRPFGVDENVIKHEIEKICGNYKHCGVHHDAFLSITENRIYDSFNKLCEPTLCEISSILNGHMKNLLNKYSVSGNAFVLKQANRGEIVKDVSIAVIMNNYVLRKIENLIGEFYLLPSSRFEWIVIPYDHEIPMNDLMDMAHNVDNEVVEDDYILSYQVLRCSNGRLTPV